MRIVAVINDLTGGGAERVLHTLARHWQKLEHEVIILTLDDNPTPYSWEGIRVEPLTRGTNLPTWLRVPGVLWQSYLLARRLRELQPQAALGFLFRANLVVILAGLWRVRTPRWISEHLEFRAQFATRPLASRVAAGLRRLFYPRASGIISVSEGVRRGLIALGLPAYLIVAVPNPVDLDEIDRRSGTGRDPGRRIITMGRLQWEKDQEMLIRACAPLLREHDATLEIIGEGALHQPLEELARSLGVSDRVQLVGWLDNPYQRLRESTVFAFSSRYEGFGVALVEAMACGLPVVSTSPSGPEEILGQGRYGLLVPSGDEEAMRTALRRVLCDEALRQELRQLARERARRYDVEIISGTYLALLPGRRDPRPT